MDKEFYSSYRNPKLLKKGTLTLLDGNIEPLLSFMYDSTNHQGIFGHPEIRIGLSIKLLHNLKGPFGDDMIKPILNDIEELLDNDNYLDGTGNADKRRQCLEEEYQFVQKYLDIDDNITLNTEYKVTGKKKGANDANHLGGGEEKYDPGMSECTVGTIGPIGPYPGDDVSACFLM